MKYLFMSMFIFAFYSVANASDLDHCTTWKEGGITSQDQAKMAISIAENFSDLSNAIPTLSPDEQEWLQEEYYNEIKRNDGKYTQRSLAAEFSKELAAEQSKILTQRIIFWAHHLSVEGDYYGQIYSWSKISSVLVDRQYSDRLLKLVEKGIISEDKIPFPVNHLHPNMSLYAVCILDKIIPSIARNIESEMIYK